MPKREPSSYVEHSIRDAEWASTETIERRSVSACRRHYAESQNFGLLAPFGVFSSHSHFLVAESGIKLAGNLLVQLAKQRSGVLEVGSFKAFGE